MPTKVSKICGEAKGMGMPDYDTKVIGVVALSPLEVIERVLIFGLVRSFGGIKLPGNGSFLIEETSESPESPDNPDKSIEEIFCLKKQRKISRETLEEGLLALIEKEFGSTIIGNNDFSKKWKCTPFSERIRCVLETGTAGGAAVKIIALIVEKKQPTVGDVATFCCNVMFRLLQK